MPTAYLYGSEASKREARHGLSLEAQQARALVYVDQVLSKLKYRLGGFFSDTADCAQADLGVRPNAGAMLSLLNKGDAVVIARTEMAFANLRDMLETYVYLQRRQVSLHLLDLDVATSTEEGRRALDEMCRLTNLRRWASRSLRDKAMGPGRNPPKWTKPPYPYKRQFYGTNAGKGQKSRLVIDRKLKAAGELFYRMHLAGKSVYSIRQACCKRRLILKGKHTPCPITIRNIIRQEAEYQRKLKEKEDKS